MQVASRTERFDRNRAIFHAIVRDGESSIAVGKRYNIHHQYVRDITRSLFLKAASPLQRAKVKYYVAWSPTSEVDGHAIYSVYTGDPLSGRLPTHVAGPFRLNEAYCFAVHRNTQAMRRGEYPVMTRPDAQFILQ